MIGFSLSATSNTIFTRNYDQYTEGDFWLSDAVSVLSKIPGLGLSGKVIAQGSKGKDVINAALATLMNGCLAELSDVQRTIGVTVHGTGDTFLAHTIFNYDDSGFSMVKRFVMTLKRASDVYGQEIGDQVMVQICKTIKMFDDTLPRDTFGQLWIELDF